MLASTLLLQGSSPDEADKTLLQIAESHFKNGEFAQTERLLTESLNQNPSGPDAEASYFILGQAQARQNKFDAALRTFTGCVFRFPKTETAAKALEQQALIHDRRNNATEVRRLRQQLLTNHPTSPTTIRIWTETADELFEQGKFAEAVAIYRQLDGKLPPKSERNLSAAKILADGIRNPQTIISLADQALADDDRGMATMLYEQLAKSPTIGSDLPKVQTRLAWCLSLQRNEQSRDRAIKLWQEVIRNSRPSDPFHAEAKWHLVRHAAGPERNWQKAVSLCREIIAGQPAGSFRHEQALFSKAWLLTVHNQGEAAVAAFERFAAAYPEKAMQPPIRRHRERAEESAANKSSKR